MFFDQQEDLKQVEERLAVGLALDPLQTSCHLILLNSLHPNISINFLHTFFLYFSFGIEKENLFLNQSFLGCQSLSE